SRGESRHIGAQLKNRATKGRVERELYQEIVLRILEKAGIPEIGTAPLKYLVPKPRQLQKLRDSWLLPAGPLLIRSHFGPRHGRPILPATSWLLGTGLRRLLSVGNVLLASTVRAILPFVSWPTGQECVFPVRFQLTSKSETRSPFLFP